MFMTGKLVFTVLVAVTIAKTGKLVEANTRDTGCPCTRDVGQDLEKNVSRKILCRSTIMCQDAMSIQRHKDQRINAQGLVNHI